MNHDLLATSPVPLPLVVACLVLATVALVMRYRRAQSEERLQLTWLAVAAFGLGLAALAGLSTELLGLEASAASELVGTLSIAGIPLTVTLPFCATGCTTSIESSHGRWPTRC